MKRRNFGLMLVGLLMALTPLGGCPSFESIEGQVASYVSLGLLAFSQILSLVGGPSPALQVVITDVRAAFAAITAAVAEYNNAPASAKSTLIGKIITAIQDAEDQLSTFLNAVGAGPAGALIAKLIGIMLTTFEGFIQKLAPTSTPTAARRQLRVRGQIVTPVFRSQKQFKKDFNAALVAGGHKELELH